MSPALRREAAAPLLLLVLVAVAFGGTLAGDFVFDDVRFVRDNPALDRVGNPLRFFTDPGTADPTHPPDIYRPLRTLHFAVDRALFGRDPRPFHAVSVALHALNALLVLALLRRMGAEPRVACAAGAMFAVHPAHVEAVAWISSRADLLSAAFVLAGILSWLRSRGPDRWYAMACGAGLLAAMAREAAVVYPLLLLAVDLARPGGGGPARALARWPRYLPPLALALGYAVAARALLESARGLPLGHLLGWWGGSYAANLATAARAAAYQALHAAVPLRPSLDWYLTPSTSLADPAALVCGAALAAALGVAVRALLVRGGAGPAGVVMAALAAFLTSHVVFPVGIPTAERFLYLPLAGLAVAATPVLGRIFRVVPRGGPLLAAVAVAAMALSSALRGRVWSDEATLWERGPSGVYSPRGVRAFVGRDLRRVADALDAEEGARAAGDAAAAARILAEARAIAEASLPRIGELNDFWERHIAFRHAAPLEARARRLLSTVLLRSGDADGALREAREAHRLDPRAPSVLATLATALHATGAAGEAGRRMEEALALATGGDAVDPGDAAAVLNGAAEERLRRGAVAAALRALRASARLVPDPARNGAAARVREIEARVVEARKEVRDAVAAAGGDPAAWARLVIFEGQAGDGVAAARRLFAERFPAAPQVAFFRTVWALATMEADDTTEGWAAAEAWHRETLAVAPGDPGARLGLARCAEALGRRDEARGRFREILADGAVSDDARAEAAEGLRRLDG